MDLRKIKKLMTLLENSGLDELELREGEETIRLRRNRVLEHETAPAATPQDGERGKQQPETEQEASGHTVRSPMVGIFYASPKPDSPPFVKIGQQVRKGEVLCIIEAMKVMNQIEADGDGVITRVLVENGAPVEYRQALFQLR